MPDTLLEMPARRAKTDPARFEVVKNALYSAAEEMKIVLAKTAYSPLLKVAGDYSCGIFDAEGNMVAQGPDLPIHLGSMPDAVKAVVAAFPEVEPGDVFIHNDPYHGGSHLPDVNVVMPAFIGERLLGFGCVRAHWPDIGSATPGSYGAVTEIYGEGLRLPPVRLYRNGRPDPDIERIIFANVRTPAERQGDLRAPEPDAALRACRGDAGRADAAPARIARRRRAAAQQQGRFHRPRRGPRRHASPRLRLRPARRPRPGAVARGSGRRVCQRRSSAARIWSCVIATRRARDCIRPARRTLKTTDGAHSGSSKEDAIRRRGPGSTISPCRGPATGAFIRNIWPGWSTGSPPRTRSSPPMSGPRRCGRRVI